MTGPSSRRRLPLAVLGALAVAIGLLVLAATSAGLGSGSATAVASTSSAGRPGCGEGRVQDGGDVPPVGAAEVGPGEQGSAEELAVSDQLVLPAQVVVTQVRTAPPLVHVSGFVARTPLELLDELAGHPDLVTAEHEDFGVAAEAEWVFDRVGEPATLRAVTACEGWSLITAVGASAG